MEVRNFKNVEKGDTYTNDEGNVFIAGINCEGWASQIECYGHTKREAEVIRNTLLVFLKKDVMAEVQTQIKTALDEAAAKGEIG